MSATIFCSFQLFQRDGDSYTSKGQHYLESSRYANVEYLIQVARGHIPPEDAQAGDLNIEVHELDKLDKNLSPREFHTRLAKVITPENRVHPHNTFTDISQPQNLIVFYTYAPISIRFAIFQKKPSSYAYLAHDSLSGLHTQNVAVIEAVVRARLRTLIQDGDLTGAFDVAVWDPIDSIIPESKAREPLRGLRKMLKEKEKDLNDAYFRTQCDRLIWSDKLTRITNPQSLVITVSERQELCFDFGVFRKSSTSLPFIELGYYKGRPGDTVQMIENAARECIDLRYEASDVGDICVYEPQVSYAEAYNAPPGKIANLNPNSGKLGTSAVRLPTTRKLWEIDCKVLIVVFDVKLRFTYSMFKRTLTSLDYVSSGFVNLSNGRTVKAMLTSARGMMNTALEARTPDFFEVRVYKPIEGFEEAIGNTFLGSLNLDEDHERNHKWDPAKHPHLRPESALSDLNPNQNFLVVFFPPLPADIAKHVG